MTAQELKRKLTAILSADVKGYSRLMGDDEEWTVRTLDTFKNVMKSIIPQHRGRVVDSTGDNLLAEFASVVDAVQAGLRSSRCCGPRTPCCQRTGEWSSGSGSTSGT